MGILDDIAKGGIQGLRAFYDVAFDRMSLPSKKRIQPNPNRTPFLDSDYKTPSGVTFSENLGASYPRNPNPMAKLPKGDRARALITDRNRISPC